MHPEQAACFSPPYSETAAVDFYETLEKPVQWTKDNWQAFVLGASVVAAGCAFLLKDKATLPDPQDTISPEPPHSPVAPGPTLPDHLAKIFAYNPLAANEAKAAGPEEQEAGKRPEVSIKDIEKHRDGEEILPPFNEGEDSAQVTAQSVIYSEEVMLKAANEADSLTGNHNGQVTVSELNFYIDYLATLPSPPTLPPCTTCTFQIFLPLVSSSGSAKSPAEFLRDNYPLFTAYRGNKEVMDVAGFKYNDVKVAMLLDLQPGFSEYDRNMGTQTSIHKSVSGPGISVLRAMQPFVDLIELPISTANLNDPTMEYLQLYAPAEIISYQNWKNKVASTISWQGDNLPVVRSKIVVQAATLTWGWQELWWQYVGPTGNQATWKVADIDACGYYYPTNKRIAFDSWCTDLDIGYGNLFQGRGVAAHDMHTVTRHEFGGHALDTLDGSLDGILWEMPPTDVSIMRSKYFLFLDSQSRDIGSPSHQLTEAMQAWFEAPEVHGILTDEDGILDRYFRLNSRTRTPIH